MFSGHVQRISALSWSRNGRYLLSASGDWCDTPPFCLFLLFLFFPPTSLLPLGAPVNVDGSHDACRVPWSRLATVPHACAVAELGAVTVL